MKVKRQKHVRKVLTFYKTNYGYHPPYNVLVDGTFCKAALKFQINISEQLPKYLDAEIKLITTKCVMAECEALGSLLYGPLKILRQYCCLSCGHDPVFPAGVCVKRQARKKRNKYLIATQDPQLSDKIRKLTGVPLLYISHNAINIEKPSDASRHKSEEALQDKLLASKSEQDKIKALKVKVLGQTEPKNKRKRKGHKEPNPLSCKKKKKTSDDRSSQQEVKRKRKRYRKRSLPKDISDVVI
ncbi:hypothetical protein LSH36_1141g00029 [Paralvinella palmiformis]|uniref:rRNA-processing protein UTP23 homolog n=1 Tax=Paralvinella palmiformis TaxID=53620 RepID=A0AAD9IV93_9ANNE|nr:hypothetical protein LSH36_1141g00029 [Paralvinella palmiformis]